MSPRRSCGSLIWWVKRAAWVQEARGCGEFRHGDTSTDARIRCWQGCHDRPQAVRLCAGEVATGVHRQGDCVLARLPRVSTDARMLCWQGCHRRHCAAQYRYHSHSAAQSFCPVAVRAARPSLGGTPKFRRSSREHSPTIPTFVSCPARNPSFTARSGGVSPGANVTGEVTATRRFGVLQMSGLRSNVPLHLVATWV